MLGAIPSRTPAFVMARIAALHAMSGMREIRAQNSCALSSSESRKIALPKLNNGANR